MHVEVPLGINWTRIGGTGNGAVVLQLTERVEHREGPPRGLGGPPVEHKFTHGDGGGGGREAVYASTAALHASPVVCVKVAVFTYWTALLNCRRARGHDGAHVPK